jgi:signal peptidase I
MRQPGKRTWITAPFLMSLYDLDEAGVTMVQRKKVATIRLWIGIAILIPLLLVFVILKSGRVETYKVISNSMYPTLKVGECVFVSISKNYTPQRNDIVVFQNPASKGEYLVKRAVAITDDDVAIRNGHLQVNGTMLQEGEINKQLIEYKDFSTKVKENHIFVLGDNRNNSFDSLDFGQLERKNILGKVTYIYWPLTHIRAVK